MDTVKRFLKRYFVDAMGSMALGLFSSLIIGLILSQIAKIPIFEFLLPYSKIIGAKSPVVGAAIGGAIAYGMKSKPLVMFSCIVVGAYGYQLGGPVGAYVATVIAAEVGGLVAGKTKVDIVISPIVTIVTGGLVGGFAGPAIANLMTSFGHLINMATELSPLPMGILVAVLVGMALTAPISSAAICIMLQISGLAAGAATIGCCCQMMGFAVASYKDNGIGGFVSQGIGTSMLQFGNIVRHPQIWLAPTLASVILGPISTCLLGMTNTSLGAGMGTSGLVGQFGTFAAMSEYSPAVILVMVVVMHFIAPMALTLLFDGIFRKIGLVKKGYMKITTD